MRTNLRTQFDSGANYYKLLELARIIESANFHEDSKSDVKVPIVKGKSKMNVATVDSPIQQMQQMQHLQGAVKGLTQLLQGNQQPTQLSHIPLFIPQISQRLVQDELSTLPHTSQVQGSTNFQRGRGGRGSYRGRGGRGRGSGRGGLILCYWCRDFLPKEQANHKVAQCPYQSQAKNDWWKNQLGSIQGDAHATQSDNKEH